MEVSILFDFVISIHMKDFIIILSLFCVSFFAILVLILRERDFDNLFTLGFMSVFATFIFGFVSFGLFPSVFHLMKDTREHNYQEAYSEFKEHFNPSNVEVLVSEKALMKGNFLNYKLKDTILSDENSEELNAFRNYCSEYYLTCTITYENTVYFAFSNSSFYAGHIFKENLKNETIFYPKGIKFKTSLDNFK